MFFKKLFISCCLLLEIYFVVGNKDFPKNEFHPPYDLQKILNASKNVYNNIYLHNAFGKEDSSTIHELISGNKQYKFENELPFIKSSKCLHDLIFVIQNVLSQWSIQMLDSCGKLESGFLKGNTKWLGNYDECLKVHAPPKNSSDIGNFNGQYCLLQVTVKIQNFSLPFTTAICLPDTCSASELNADFLKLSFIISEFVPFLNLNNSMIQFNGLTCKASVKQLNAAAIGVICLMSFFGLLVVIGSSFTVYEYFCSRKPQAEKAFNYNDVHVTNSIQGDTDKISNHVQDSDEQLLLAAPPSFVEKCKPFFNCFCLFTNGAKILNTDSTEGQLLSLHGIRFFSMSWVILGHTYAFCFTVINNSASLVDIYDFPFQVVLNGFFSVDSFFVLSGFLLTYLFMKEVSKKNKISWIYFYVHRFIRLTPVYMIVLGFSSTVFLYMGSGPYWPDNDVDLICKDYWWYNILYINNFLDMSHMCMGWSWYLANDMQFYVISPIILIALWKWPVVAFALLSALLSGTWLSNFIITYHYDLFASMIPGNPKDIAFVDLLTIMAKYMDYFNKIYIKPYTRIGPYLVGMFVGYFVFKAKANNWPKFNKIILLTGWIIATAVGLACVYGLYNHTLSLLAASFYNAFSRMCFGGALGWVIYVCLTGQGGAVDSILSYKLFIPLSRLTYVAYLIHPLIVTGYFTSLKSSMHFSHPTMVILYLGFMLSTYGLALLVSLLFESPIIRLERLLMNKLKKSRD